MKGLLLRFLSRKWQSMVALLTVVTFLAGSTVPALAMDSARGGALPQPLPLFPPDNWWNLDISNWPVDANSANFISFINNGGTRRLHPDFGGNAGTGNAIYGMPYATVTNVTNADLKAVQFQYWRESDGVDHATNTSFPFYPIPPEAITQPSWVEGGDPGNVDLRSSQDRHLLIVDKDRNHLYELYNVYYQFHPRKMVRRLGSVLRHEHQQSPARYLDFRGRGWTSDSPRPGALRRSLRPECDRDSPCSSVDGACHQWLRLSCFAPGRFDIRRTAHGRTVALESKCRCYSANQ